MTNDSSSMPLIPRPLNSMEQAERFCHEDLNADMDAMRAWSEALLIEYALADLVFRKRRGACLHYGSGGAVYEIDWLQDRLSWLRTFLRKVAA